MTTKELKINLGVQMTREKGKWKLIKLVKVKPRTGGTRQRRGRDPRQLHLAATQQWKVSVNERLSEYVLIFERVPT